MGDVINQLVRTINRSYRVLYTGESFLCLLQKRKASITCNVSIVFHRLKNYNCTLHNPTGNLSQFRGLVGTNTNNGIEDRIQRESVSLDTLVVKNSEVRYYIPITLSKRNDMPSKFPNTYTPMFQFDSGSRVVQDQKKSHRYVGQLMTQGRSWLQTNTFPFFSSPSPPTVAV